MNSSASPSKRRPLSPRGIAWASLIGTTIEWYDFFVYSTSAAIVLGTLFFPSGDPLTSTLVSVSTIGVAFLARPLGGVIFGHFGDRFGRKNALVTSLVMMGGATVLIGFLPTYAQMGAVAPVLLVLLRVVQGLAVGGEWGGAVLLAVEHAPPGKRVFYGSFPQFGSPLGILSSAGVIALFQLLPDEQFMAWGWRMPFLISIALLVVGMVLRLRIEESTEGMAGRSASHPVRVPIRAVLGAYRGRVVIGVGITLVNHATYIITSFMPSYVISRFGVPAHFATTSLIISAIVMLVVQYLVARRSDWSQWRRAAFAGLAVAVWAFPAFAIGIGWRPWGVVLAVTVGFAANAVLLAVLSTMLAALFPANVRYTGISLCYQVSAIIGGGLLPIVATMLVTGAGGVWWPAATLLTIASSCTAVAAVASRRVPSELVPEGDPEGAAPTATR